MATGAFIKSADPQVDVLKVPPHSIEAEQAVLGGVMIDNEAWEIVAEPLSEEAFYRVEHRLIFRALRDLHERDSPLDVLTVSDFLKQRQQLSQMGGEAYLFELARNTPTAANVAAYAKIVYERFIFRQLLEVSNDIANHVFQPEGRTAQELLDYAERKIFEISSLQRSRRSGPQHINVVMPQTVDSIETQAKSDHTLLGLSTGFADLDERTSGLQPGELTIVAARPSMGKTSFAMNMAEHAALDLARQKNPKAVLVFSMEMPAEQLVMRMLSSLGRIELQNLRTGKLKDPDWLRVTQQVKILSETKLLIDDTPGLSPFEVRTRARRVAWEYGGLGLIVVDYLQLMQVPGYGENRVAEVSVISRSLKALAKELKVPVVALSQLNRSLETRINKRPVMSDIRESGSIEQDADLILFIYRDEVYNENSPEKNQAEIIIGKHRNGPIGMSKIRFEGRYTRFDNLDLQHLSQ